MVVLLVPCALDRPVRFDSEAYIRVGSHTTKLNRFPEKESRLWQLSNTRNFEHGLAIEAIQASDVFDLLDYQSYFNLPISQSRKTTKPLFKHYSKKRLYLNVTMDLGILPI